ncbi:MAG: CDP-alcohol phosphatidyltransferase family protein [bacterium]
MKKHIPNFITLLNQMSGIVACIMAYNESYDYALLFVIIGAAFDFCDGAAARLLKVSSPMGKELDSLADMISFGLVPGMVAYKLLAPLAEIWEYLPYFGFVITLFSALRLAKFNIDERQTSSFIGLATPANALFWLGAVYGYNDLIMTISPWYIVGGVVLFSYLLICEMPIFALKFKNFSWGDNRVRYIFIIGVAALIATLQLQSLPIIIIWYLLVAIIDNITKKFA